MVRRPYRPIYHEFKEETVFDGDVQIFLRQISVDVDFAATSRVVSRADLEDRRIPLVVSATGHTDLSDDDRGTLFELAC